MDVFPLSIKSNRMMGTLVEMLPSVLQYTTRVSGFGPDDASLGSRPLGIPDGPLHRACMCSVVDVSVCLSWRGGCVPDMWRLCGGCSFNEVLAAGMMCA